MATYIPPHKRHLKDGAKALEKSSHNSRSFAHKFHQKLNLSGSGGNSESCSSSSDERVMRNGKDASLGGRYAYAKSCLSTLCIADCTKEEEEEHHQYPGSIRMKHLSLESTFYKKQGTGKTPYVLVSSHEKTGTNKINQSSSEECPLMSVTQQILPNLHAFRKKRVEGCSKEFEEGNIYFGARFGKILFHGIPLFNMDTIRDRSEYEASLSRILRSFNTNVPKSFTQSVLNVVVPEIGVDFDEEKEYYYVRVVDKTHPEVSPLSCKCTATEVGGLELQKIETSNERHMIVDVACIEKDLDLRLMLSTRKIVADPRDEEKHDLEKVIKSAVVDQNEKGGLRFPVGNELCESRYRVVGIGRTTSRAYKNSSIVVKLNEVDRYDFITSTAEVTNHVVLKMTGISEKLMAINLDADQLSKMLEDNLKIIWNYFLRLERCSPLNN